MPSQKRWLIKIIQQVFVQETSGQDRGSHQSVAVAANGDYVVVWTDEVEITGNFADVSTHDSIMLMEILQKLMPFKLTPIQAR